MIKKLFFISSAVLAVAGLPQYAQTLTGFFLEETPDATRGAGLARIED